MSDRPATLAPRSRLVIARAGVALLVTALYTALAWLVLFGRSTILTSQSFAGGIEHDAGTYIWYLHHLKEGLFGDGELLFSDRLFYPVGMDMVRQDWTPATSAMGLPFQGLGSIGAYNLEVLLAFVLCGLFTYLLARELGSGRCLAFLAGMIFAFCEFRILKSVYHGHLTHVNQQFIPLYLFFAFRYFRRRRIGDAAMGGLAFFLATFCTPYQMVFLLVFSTILLGHRLLADLFEWRPFPRRRRVPLGQALGPSLGFAGLAGTSAVLLVLPLILAVGLESIVLMPGALSRFQSIFSADLLSYVIPTLGKDMGWPHFSGEGGCAFQGYTVMTLGLVALYAQVRHRAGIGLWIGAGFIFFLLSLGSMLVIGGQEVMWLPFYAVLEQIPIIRHARVASRFSALLTLCLAVGIAVALTRLEAAMASGRPAWQRHGVRGLVLIAVAVELLGYRVEQATLNDPGIRPFPIPSVYTRLAAQAEDSSLLVYPLVFEVASAHLGPLHFPRDYYYFQTVHKKRLITGFGDAVPATTLEYFKRLPLVDRLVQIEAGEPVQAPGPDEQADARTLVRALGLRTILLNRVQVTRDQVRAEQTSAAALAYLRQLLPLRVQEETESAVVLEVPDEVLTRAAGGVETVDFQLPSSVVYLGSGIRRAQGPEGWQAETALVGAETEMLYLPLVGRSPAQVTGLTFTLRCTHAAARLSVELNGRRRGETALDCPAAWGQARLDLPAGSLRSGMNRLRLRRQGETDLVALPVGRTGVRTHLQLQVQSQGLAAGNRASIKLGETDLAPDTRGYNVSVLDPASGAILLSTAFDLVADQDGQEAARMLQLLHGVPEGSIVCLAVKDDGSINLGPALVLAMRGLGASRDLRGALRASYALIGVKGAAPGTALEAFDPTAPAVVELGSQLQIRSIRY